MAPDTATHFYDRLLLVFRNAAALIVLAMVPLGLAARTGLADGRFYSGDATFVALTLAYGIAAGLYFLYKKQKSRDIATLDIAFLVVFHLLTALFTLFVTGFLSAFLAVWIVLMANTDGRFGIRGFATSAIGILLTCLAFITLYPQLGGSEQAETLQGVIAVGIIGFVIARITTLTNHERSALQKTRESEAYQRERLTALINSMGDAVVATDDKGAINIYNSALLGLLDTNLSLTGKPIDEMLQLFDSSGRAVSILQDAHNRRTAYSCTDLLHKFPDGEVMNLYINVAPIQPSYQSRTEHGYIFILRDITKEKSLEEERDEFVSVVSHELRTPLTIAEGNLSNMQLLFNRGAEKAVMAKAIEDAHQQMLYLAKLVNDLSTLARAERGTGGQAEDIDVVALLHQMFTTYTPQAEAKSLHLNLNLPPSLPKVTSNPLYLQEIMQNLITNAIKYTQTGSVTIGATPNADGLALTVTDTGIGIGKSDQQHVFEKFYRSEDYRTRESSGTGLGLYVCQKLTERLGFALTFESRLNHGSIFTLQIPADHLAKPEVAA